MRTSFGNSATRPRTVYLAFDADGNGSGQQAAQSLALHALREQGLNVRTGLAARRPRSQQLLCPGRRCAPVPVAAGGGSAMKFRVVHQQPTGNLHKARFASSSRPPAARSAGSIGILDRECLRRLAEHNSAQLRARSCCTFSAGGKVFTTPDDRCRNATHRIDIAGLRAIPVQPTTRPAGSTINQRVAVVDRALRIEFPDAPRQIAPRLSSDATGGVAPMGLGRPRLALEPIAREDSQANHRAVVGG